MQYFNFNGNLFPVNTPVVSSGSPGLRYGSGLFETIKVLDGDLIFPEEHFARLWKGLTLFQYKIPYTFTKKLLAEEIKTLVSLNEFHNARVRLAVYSNVDSGFDYAIETEWLSGNTSLNEKGITLGIFPDGRKVCDAYSNLKHNNYLIYYLGKKFSESNRFDDVVILNDKGNICDTSKANMFIIKENKIFTPDLGEGCVAGIIRGIMIEELKALNYKVVEMPLSTKDLEMADEIFVTNAIIDMQWVGSYSGIPKDNEVSKKIYEQIFLKN